MRKYGIKEEVIWQTDWGEEFGGSNPEKLTMLEERYYRPLGAHLASIPKGRKGYNGRVGLLVAVFLYLFYFSGCPFFCNDVCWFLRHKLSNFYQGSTPVVAKTLYETAANYPYTIIPLFILMGGLAGSAGITRELYKSFDK